MEPRTHSFNGCNRPQDPHCVEGLPNHANADLGSELHYTELFVIQQGTNQQKWWKSQFFLLWHLRFFYLLFPFWPAASWWQVILNRVLLLVVSVAMVVNNAVLIGSLHQFISDVKYIPHGHFYLVALVYPIVSYFVIGHYLNWNHFRRNRGNCIIPSFVLMHGRTRYELPSACWITVNIILLLGWLVLVVGMEMYRLIFYKTYNTPIYVVQAVFNDLSNLLVVVACCLFYVSTEVVVVNIEGLESYLLSEREAGLSEWKQDFKRVADFCEFVVSKIKPWFIFLMLFCLAIVGIIVYSGIVHGFRSTEQVKNAPFDKVQYVGFSVIVLFVLSFSFLRASAVTSRFRTLIATVNTLSVTSKELEFDKFLFLSYIERCNPGFKICNLNVTIGFAFLSVGAAIVQALSVLRNILK